MATSGSRRGSNSSSARRTSTGVNSSSGRRNTSTSHSTQRRKEVDTQIKQEAIVLIVFCVVLMLFLCMINVIKGSFGPAVKTIMLGIFGVLGYVMPIIIALGFCFNISNKGNRVATLKFFSAAVLLFMIGLLTCYFTGTDLEYIATSDKAVKVLYDMQGGGGVVFGLVSLWLFKLFGQAGSIFLAIVFAIICLVIITEKSFIKKIKQGKDFFGSTISYRENDEYDEEDDGQYLLPEHSSETALAIRKSSNSEDDMDEAEERRLRRQREQEARERARERERERARARQERKEAEKEEQRRVLEQKEDERILNHSNRHSKMLDINEILIEEEPKSPGLDDIHEITVLPNLSDTSANDIVPVKEEVKRHDSIQEITIHNAFEDEEATETVMPPEPTNRTTVETQDNSTPSTGNTSTFEMSNTVVQPMMDLSNMPQPVTERSHQNDTVISNEPKEEPKPVQRPRKYEKPRISFLKKNEKKNRGDSDQQLKETALLLQQTLKTFGVPVTVTDISQGPSVTRYELQLGEGVKVNKIVNLADDIKLNLAAQDIRIEAPIPGKAAVGIELPNKETSAVLIRDLIESAEYRNATSNLAFAVGKDITGKTIVADIAKMPHMLVAGATGSGKSVCINTLIMSILYNAHPDDVKLIMIDPKVVELSVYNGIPHLLIPVVTDPRKANAALQWAVNEMTKRYKAFADFGLRDLKGFNKQVEKMQEKGENNNLKKMPQIIVIVDELADLMMVASKEVEESICRLAQLARAAGIHLVIATQRPSVDVITGLIKANMPSRVAFKVTSGVDSRTILDMVGAEKLLGKGDMLFYPQGYSKPLRVQGAFVSDEEVSDVVDFLKKNAGDQCYDEAVEKQIAGMSEGEGEKGSSDNEKGSSGPDNSLDAYFDEACRFVVEKEKASSGMLQRVFKVGYTRAARIVDQMEAAGVVGPEEGTKPRKVLMNSTQLEEFLNKKNNS